MTRSQELLGQLRRLQGYRHASRVLKPLRDPVRFTMNQARRWGLAGRPYGEISRVDVLHLSGMHVVNGEWVSEELAAYGTYEESLTEAFIHLVRPGMRVLDIGMHLGFYTTLFAELVGSAGTVVAFEPTPSTRELAKGNVGRYGWVSVEPLAVWSGSGDVVFKDYGLKWMAFNGAGEVRQATEGVQPVEYGVRTIALDQWRLEHRGRVDLLKVDAESAELEILKGARVLLAEDRPLVSLEVGDTEGATQSSALVDLLSQAGYRAWEFIDGGFRRHNQLRRYGYDNLLFAPDGWTPPSLVRVD